MINFEEFREELSVSVKEAEDKDGTGPDVHAKALRIILNDIKKNWDYPEDALDEIYYEINKAFPIAKLSAPNRRIRS